MRDPILNDFFILQRKEAAALTAVSDLVTAVPADASSLGEAAIGDDVLPPMVRSLLAMAPVEDPPTRYLVSLRCNGLVRSGNEEPRLHNQFVALIQFPFDHLRTFDPRVVSLLCPFSCWHANILGPAVCVGRQAPGAGIVDLTYQLFEILTYQNYATDNPLNEAAAAWARRRPEMFPLDRRPIKRRRVRGAS